MHFNILLAIITCIYSIILFFIITNLSTLCIQYDQLPVSEQESSKCKVYSKTYFSAVFWWYI